MHLTLTDHLTCPRCGPSAGLILFMERAEERRVVTGALGCPVCRTQYPIVERVADLRGGGAEARGGAAGRTDVDAEAALRVAALLDLSGERGFVVLDGPGALGLATRLAELVPDVEPVVRVATEDAADVARAPVSAFMGAASLPIADRTMRGAAWVGGTPDAASLVELVRVCRPTGRVVVETAGGGGSLDLVAAELERLGAKVRARDGSGLVAVVL